MLNELVHSARYIQQVRLAEHASRVTQATDTRPGSGHQPPRPPHALRSKMGRGLIALGHRLLEDPGPALDRAA
jgi:hypothetical protein